MTSSELFEGGTFCGQKYLRMKDQKPWHVLERKQDFAQERGLKTKSSKMQRAEQRSGRFFLIFLKKIAI